VFIPQPSGCVIDRHHRAAKRPATSESQIKAQSQFARFLGSEPQGVKEAVGEKRQGPDSLFRIIQHQRINRLHFKAADAAFFHQLHLALEFRLCHRRAEPPPAHHDPRVVRRIQKRPLQIIDGSCERNIKCRKSECKNKQWSHHRT
jgi:hypothetical protein